MRVKLLTIKNVRILDFSNSRILLILQPLGVLYFPIGVCQSFLCRGFLRLKKEETGICQWHSGNRS